ncbi:alkanesulfonate monooxygenase SsuD/methylene tetrahydromethanopterin reductase-like flavin-dependent oxidoreductase (luciferase family) [Paraburkholderia sp. JPY419]
MPIPTGSGRLDPCGRGERRAADATFVPVALRTSLGGRSVAARAAATLDAATGGRLLLNVMPGGDAEEPAADGVFMSHDESYEAASEYLTIWRRLLPDEAVEFRRPL